MAEDRSFSEPQSLRHVPSTSSRNVRSSDGISVTALMRRFTRRTAPYIPKVIRYNWITILVLLFFAWMTYVTITVWSTAHNTRHLAVENSHRITDIRGESLARDHAINLSRQSSCKDTYRTIQAILKASAAGRHLTPRGRQRYVSLLMLADPDKCIAQTRTKPASPTGGG